MITQAGARTSARRPRVATLWLALLAGPISLGISGPVLVLPDVARELGVSLVEGTALVTAFGWGIAVGTPFAGAVVARFGLRAAMIGHVALVATGAVVVLVAPTLPAPLAVLVVGTGLQALGSAGLMVAAMNLAGSAASLGAVTASLATFGAVGPLAGSAVSSALSWPAALAMPVLSLLVVPAVLRGAAGTSPAPAGGGRFDILGAGLLVATITALVFVPRQPVVAGLVTVVAAALLAAHVRKRPDGFVPARVVTSRLFVITAVLAFGLAVVNFGIIYAAPGFLTAMTGWTGSELGIAMLVPYLVAGVASSGLVAATARLSLPLVGASVAAGSVAALVLVGPAGAMAPALYVGMMLGALAAATGQGALGHRARAALPDSLRSTTMGLFTLCFLLGAAFGPVLAALVTGG